MCMTPFCVKRDGQETPVPCGKCPECCARRVSGWSFRLMQEDKNSESAYFITLTYDTNFVPITGKGFMDLSKEDLQKFFKRLRKATVNHRHQAHGGYRGKVQPNECPECKAAKPIKYYAVGEYGGRTFRPHYHIILFNAVLELIQPAWDKGSVHYGTVTGASIGYSLKYISKPGKIPLHGNDDRQKEFALMSKGSAADILLNQLSDGIRPT